MIAGKINMKETDKSVSQQSERKSKVAYKAKVQSWHKRKSPNPANWSKVAALNGDRRRAAKNASPDKC